MQIGDIIPVATVGSILPDGMEIAQRKLRGEISNGMCCSANEIGLGDDSDGIMILPENDPDHKWEIGGSVSDTLGLESDIVWDLEVNANRPDAMSISGVARDLAASLRIPFEFPMDRAEKPQAAVEAGIKIDIEDATLCGRFLACVVKGITVGPSPQWLQNRLIHLGMRPINNVVDISNYVMLELGQPNHTYDLKKIEGARLTTRRAKAGETILTLDDVERSLSEIDGVIVDGDDNPVGIAGIMGGASSEISKSTTEIVIEVAWWDPPSISRSVKNLNLMSEASMRFRRGADYGINMERSVNRMVQLLNETCEPEMLEIVQVDGNLPDQSPVRVSKERVNGLLGFETEEVMLEEGNERPSQEGFEVIVPSWRWDTQTETDLAEEIARTFGYERIERTIPRGPFTGQLSRFQKGRRTVREILIGAGCDETMPMPFLAPGDLQSAGLPSTAISISNPLVQEESLLRTSLMPGQLKIISYNQSHRVKKLKFFEIGHIYLPSEGDQLLPDEREYLSVSIAGGGAIEIVAILDLISSTMAFPNMQLKQQKIGGLHPERSAQVLIAGQNRGAVGEIDPRVLGNYGIDAPVAWLELDLGSILTGSFGKRKYKSVSKYPSSDIDLAFEVPADTSSASIEGCIRKAGGIDLKELQLFDSYKAEGGNEGVRSLAYSLRFQSNGGTLTDGELSKLRAACIGEVEKKTDARLRE
jgi:phenylalanyl-tRNA synthetase beta chain